MYKLAICFLFILLTAAFVRAEKIKIEKDIIYSFLRAVIQVMLLSVIILIVPNLSFEL